MREAARERKANKPPQAARALFRYLREQSKPEIKWHAARHPDRTRHKGQTQ
jgi:hypothetical protein